MVVSGEMSQPEKKHENIKNWMRVDLGHEQVGDQNRHLNFLSVVVMFRYELHHYISHVSITSRPLPICPTRMRSSCQTCESSPQTPAFFSASQMCLPL